MSEPTYSISFSEATGYPTATPCPDRVQPIKYALHEGGEWYPWTAGQKQRPESRLHAIMFADGSIFDAVNGWRPWKSCTQCGAAIDASHR
jgi:hypothetical protein